MKRAVLALPYRFDRGSPGWGEEMPLVIVAQRQADPWRSWVARDR